MLIDCTSLAPGSMPKLGEILSVNGMPSKTNCVWYSAPRGCNTALPSYSHPGCELTRSCSERPGKEVARCSTVPQPIWFTSPAWYGLISVLPALTMTDSLTNDSFNRIVQWTGIEDRIRMAAEAGSKPGWSI